MSVVGERDGCGEMSFVCWWIDICRFSVTGREEGLLQRLLKKAQEDRVDVYVL